ncbi:MAG: response regulator [Candidatus Melainabacteria bacterium]|nr:response regulator [Candidatus Melainabacteria bacterium]
MTESRQPLILLVDDNPSQQKVMGILADKYGFDAVVVSSGQEALDALAACPSCFDIVLMDWQLPDMTGGECTQRIRAFEKIVNLRTPIVAVTAHAMVGDKQKCLDSGMDDYLSKPFTADDFRRLLLRWTYDPARPNLRLLPSREIGPGTSAANG